jgi:hypothetical protein
MQFLKIDPALLGEHDWQEIYNSLRYLSTTDLLQPFRTTQKTIEKIVLTITKPKKSFQP